MDTKLFFFKIVLTVLAALFTIYGVRIGFALFFRIIKAFLSKFTFFSESDIVQAKESVRFLFIGSFLMLPVLFLPMLWDLLGGVQDSTSVPIMKVLIFSVKLCFGVGVISCCYNLSDRFILFFLSKTRLKRLTNLESHLVPFVSRIAKFLVVSFGLLVLLQNMGVNVFSLVAGLGIGGVAIALAAKDSLSNILAYFNIMLDAPYSVGDWISCGHIEGTVMEIGLRSSKVKTFYDSLVSIPNYKLADSFIDNMGKRSFRRTRIFLGVQYDTPPNRLEDFISGIKKILKGNSYIRQDYFQVYFNDFGASELKIILNFFLKVQDWESELREKQNIFFNILRLAEQLKVNFAFPTQSLHIESVPASYNSNHKSEENLKIENR